MNAITTEISVSAIAAFSADGRVFRAFGSLLAAKPGELLLVPMGRTTGDLRQVTDGCPVPWSEAWAALDSLPQDDAIPLMPEALCDSFPALAMISPYGWISDEIALGAGAPDALRLIHVSGIRYVRVPL
jgi:hypothetical protein